MFSMTPDRSDARESRKRPVVFYISVLNGCLNVCTLSSCVCYDPSV